MPMKLWTGYQIWAQSVLRSMPNALLLPYLDLLYENFHHPISLSSLIQSDIPEPISTAEVLWKEEFP